MKKAIKTVLDIVIVVCAIGLAVGFARFGYFFYQKNKTSNMYADISQEVRMPVVNSTPIGSTTGVAENTDSTDDEVSEPVYQSPINFDMLTDINTDIVAWLEIKDTLIDYPVLFFSGDDSYYYLNHDFYANRSAHGSIFFGVDTGYEYKDNTYRIIYGHHMIDGTMFTDLVKFEDPSFTVEHPVITLYWPDRQVDYQIVSVFKADVSAETVNAFYYSEYLERTHENYEYMKTRIKERQLYDLQIDWDEDDELLLLSTCEYSTPNGRLVVVGKEIK